MKEHVGPTDVNGRNSGITRRSLLKGAALLAGAAALAPLWQDWGPLGKAISPLTGGSNPLTGGSNPLKVGALIPASSIYPALGEGLMAGMSLYFGQANNQAGGRRIELVSRNIGFGPSRAVEASRKLIQEDEVDFVVGVLNSGVASDLRVVFQESHTPFLINNVGANVIRPAESSPYIFHNSLNYWQASQATGVWAASNLGRRAFMATSFYDSGYDTLYAFRRGFELAGGEVIRTHTGGIPPIEDDPKQLMKAIRQARLISFARSTVASQPSTLSMPTTVSAWRDKSPWQARPFGLMKISCRLRAQQPWAIRSGLSWSASLRTPENNAFTEAYVERTGRAPGPFSVLGYDSARLIVDAANAVEGDTANSGRLLGALASARFMSPRGHFKMDPATHSSASPIYLREVRQNGGTAYNEVVAQLDGVSEWNNPVVAELSGMKTGWLNAYMSA